MLSRLGFKRSANKPYLILGMDHRRPDFKYVYDKVQKRCDAELICLKKRQLRRFPEFLRKIPLEQYQAVWLDIGFKYMHEAIEQINRCRHTVFYEEDAVQDDLATSPWQNQFSSFYRQLDNYTLFTTGLSASESLIRKGVPNRLSIKGYDPEQLFRIPDIDKTIPAGFIGSINASVYQSRKQLIDHLTHRDALTVCDPVDYGQPYRELLNRIQVFVSADIGLGEYMAKNFEAMACACVLLAYRQENGEEERLGLISGKNCFLYSTPDEALAVIEELRRDPEQRERVATAGQRLAQQSFSFDRIAKDIGDALLNSEPSCR